MFLTRFKCTFFIKKLYGVIIPVNLYAYLIHDRGTVVLAELLQGGGHALEMLYIL
eukprot:SAG11_NODE_13393_length_657_cov_1.284946_2_plen_55_part_00